MLCRIDLENGVLCFYNIKGVALYSHYLVNTRILNEFIPVKY